MSLFDPAQDITQSIQYGIGNILILTVIAAIARLLFVLGKSFMVEAIRNGDRIHAISFGKFFIQAYGDKATRNEIREVFGEWNYDKGSAFIQQQAADIDPNIIGALEAVKEALLRK